jgi:hypothetical protein
MEKALQSWRTAGEKAHVFPMNYEEGMAYLILGMHLPLGDPERAGSLEKASLAFTRGGFENWVEIVHKALS